MEDGDFEEVWLCPTCGMSWCECCWKCGISHRECEGCDCLECKVCNKNEHCSPLDIHSRLVKEFDPNWIKK